MFNSLGRKSVFTKRTNSHLGGLLVKNGSAIDTARGLLGRSSVAKVLHRKLRVPGCRNPLLLHDFKQGAGHWAIKILRVIFGSFKQPEWVNLVGQGPI
jgi:hypothetical protein